MKGLVLAGGKGSRLRPLTATGAKQLVPVGNKPVLFYAIEQLVAAGITDLGIIIGDTGDQVRAAVGDGAAFGARVTYIPQEAPLGLAHAVITAREWLGNDSFCLFLGDNFLKGGITPYVERFVRAECAAHILLKPVSNPSSFGVAVVAGGRIVQLIEKPMDPVSDLAVVGIYFFGPEIHTISPRLRPSARGELEITDAIQALIDGDYVVGAEVIADEWIDTGKKDDLLEANRLVLMQLTRRVEGTVDAESRLVGEVVIEPGAVITRSTVRGPAIIGVDTRLTDVYVGPFTAIGARCVLTACEIEYSIMLDGGTIRNIGHRIADSLIGKEVVIERSPLQPRVIRLMLGDHSQVGIVS